MKPATDESRRLRANGRKSMPNLRLTILCSVAILVSGCATPHSHPNTWEYKSATTYPEAVGAEINRLSQEGWKFVSMTGTKSSTELPLVVLLFKRHK